MFFHQCRGGRIAGKHGTGDAQICAQRTLYTIGSAEIDTTEAANRADEILIHLYQRAIAGKPHDQQVERIERFGIRVGIGGSAAKRFHRFHKLCAPNRIEARDQELNREHFERDANLVNFLNVFGPNCAYRRADMRSDNNEPFVR